MKSGPSLFRRDVRHREVGPSSSDDVGVIELDFGLVIAVRRRDGSVYKAQ